MWTCRLRRPLLACHSSTGLTDRAPAREDWLSGQVGQVGGASTLPGEAERQRQGSARSQTVL